MSSQGLFPSLAAGEPSHGDRYTRSGAAVALSFFKKIREVDVLVSDLEKNPLYASEVKKNAPKRTRSKSRRAQGPQKRKESNRTTRDS